MRTKVKELVSKSEFARMCGVSAAAVTKACRGVLKDSLTGSKIDINHRTAVKYRENQDTDIPTIGMDSLYERAVQECERSGRYTSNYLRGLFKIGKARADKILKIMRLNNVIPDDPQPKKNITIQVEKVTRKEAKRIKEEQKILKVPDDIREFADMTLKELIEKFGTDSVFSNWLKATKTIEDINEKRLKNAQTKGELVSRELIHTGVIAPIDTCHRRLLTDCARTLSIRVPAMAAAGEDEKTIEKYISGQMTSFIRPMKSKISKNLRDSTNE